MPGVKGLRMSARWLKSRLRGGAVILGYHRVAAVAGDPFGMCVSPHNFAEQLEAVRRYARPIGLQELARALRDGRVPRRAVVVTFDDGYADNLYVAKPLLERYDIPATVFVVTGYLGREFWWDRREGAMAMEQHRAGSVAGTVNGGLCRALTPEEVIALASGGLVELGAHSATHPVLAKLAQSEQRSEIAGSKTSLEALLNQPVHAFSYPHGSMTKQTMAIARDAGFACACGSANDVVSTGRSPFNLPRFWIPDWNGDSFIRWLRRWLGG